MSAMDARNMHTNLAVNKYQYKFASPWIYSTYVVHCPTRGLTVLWLGISWSTIQTVLVVSGWGSVIRTQILSSPCFVTTAMNGVARPTRHGNNNNNIY